MSEKVSDQTGRTRLRHCACGREKMQIVESDEETLVLLLCGHCDKAAVEQIATANP